MSKLLDGVMLLLLATTLVVVVMVASRSYNEKKAVCTEKHAAIADPVDRYRAVKQCISELYR
jgi:hypothetical protein